MIKIKILNPTNGRNESTFRPFQFIRNTLRDYSIEITDSDDYDYLFIGMSDFMNHDLLMRDGIDWGLEKLSNITGDYFLFDGSDSHSLMTSYDVFTQSKAIYLFKNQLLKNRVDYHKPKAFNKWFFGSGSKMDVGYDIPLDVWDRIKLTGWNMMSNIPSHKQYLNINKTKTIDICAIFGAGSDTPTPAHGVTTHLLYKSHRTKILKVVEKLSQKYNVVHGRKPFQEYMQILYNSKISISPFGMGEIRQGDGEAVQLGTTICKENMSRYDFGSNVWEENKTYIPFSYDCSDLYEVLEHNINNYDYSIVENMRDKYLQEYDYNKLCERWYYIFSNLDGIVNE